MKAAIIVFPGSNRDRDMKMALTKASGGKPPLEVWHGDADFPKVDLIVLPGGFSYGDYLRCGAMAAHSPVMREVKARADKGTRVLAVCNGFQIACEAGLLPGVLMSNAGLQFICREITMRVETSDSIFTGKYRKGQCIRVPVAHHDGNYNADADTVKRLEDEDRVAFRYANLFGDVSPETNLNGSVGNIAGVFNKGKTVLGLMPHPENATDPVCGGTDGVGLFAGLAEALQ
ncbi:phosphoribosylformylglycinamidine synthase subunit PurQ [Ferrovibrio sp.]|uniref:phosphoribosylformylglycinamidine synthase subunit PurQ n=1 Tax=Ferrovibrio sp. TaxID=1917215 RepID=UPI0035AE7366